MGLFTAVPPKNPQCTEYGHNKIEGNIQLCLYLKDYFILINEVLRSGPENLPNTWWWWWYLSLSQYGHFLISPAVFFFFFFLQDEGVFQLSSAKFHFKRSHSCYLNSKIIPSFWISVNRYKNLTYLLHSLLWLYQFHRENPKNESFCLKCF